MHTAHDIHLHISFVWEYGLHFEDRRRTLKTKNLIEQKFTGNTYVSFEADCKFLNKVHIQVHTK